MAVLNIGSSDAFQKEVLDYKGKVLVDFYAPWCGPCKAVAPQLEELSEEMADVKIVKVNVDDYGDLAAQYQVQSIPTFIVFKDGANVHQFVGGRGKEQIKQEIESVK